MQCDVVRRLGGEVVGNDEAARATHLVLEGSIEPEIAVPQLLTLPRHLWPMVHTLDWVSQCSRKKQYLPDLFPHPSREKNELLAKTQTTPSSNSQDASCPSARSIPQQQRPAAHHGLDSSRLVSPGAAAAAAVEGGGGSVSAAAPASSGASRRLLLGASMLSPVREEG